MTIEIASNIGPAKLAIAYERLGAPDATPVLLIMGLGAQLIAWPDGFCDELCARGLQLVRFDNRDAGESTHVTGTPDFAAALAGDRSGAPYTLSDMAADAVGLLDALGLGSVHVVGASLGGFVAQTMAIEHAARVRSLTSMMSTTGDRAVGQPHPEVARLVRQAVAMLVSGDRTARLRDVRVPALVIHGADDRMCDASGGRATAAAIPGAELAIIDGMGHDLPRALWPRIADAIAAVIARGEATTRRR